MTTEEAKAKKKGQKITKIIELLKKNLTWTIIIGIATIITPIIVQLVGSKTSPEERLMSEINTNCIQIKDGLKSQKKLDTYDSIPFIKAVKEYNERLLPYVSAVTLYSNAYKQSLGYVTAYLSLGNDCKQSETYLLYSLRNVVAIGTKDSKIKAILAKRISIQELTNLYKLAELRQDKWEKETKKYIKKYGQIQQKIPKECIQYEKEMTYSEEELVYIKSSTSLYLRCYNLFNEIIDKEYSL